MVKLKQTCNFKHCGAMYKKIRWQKTKQSLPVAEYDNAWRLLVLMMDRRRCVYLDNFWDKLQFRFMYSLHVLLWIYHNFTSVAVSIFIIKNITFYIYFSAQRKTLLHVLRVLFLVKMSPLWLAFTKNTLCEKF